MKEFFTGQFAQALKTLREEQDAILMRQSIPAPNLARILTSLATLKEAAQILKFDAVILLLNRLEGELLANRDGNREIGPGILIFNQVEKEIQFAINTLCADLDGRKFTCIPFDVQEFFEQENLFGLEVKAKFPNASLDIKEAGNCVAADLNTAAVFHLMRVAECGLRALAAHLGVSFPLKNNKSETWGAVIKAATNELNQAADAPEKEDYRVLLFEAAYFKDEYRDAVSHSIVHYDAPQARSALTHVKPFMQRLTAILAKYPPKTKLK